MTRILLIEDDADQRAMLQDALEAAGYHVIGAPDGNAGIEAQREARADVVITDLFMPGMEGIETIVALRKQDPAPKIIAISGGGRFRGAGADHLTVAREIGADRVLRKPFDPAQLIEAVREVLG